MRKGQYRFVAGFLFVPVALYLIFVIWPYIQTFGYSLTDFGVRDWFWSRVPTCPDAVSFVAVMGMGLEAANLEHAPVFAQRFRLVGDVQGAELQERIAADELAHVSFATRWFARWTPGI